MIWRKLLVVQAILAVVLAQTPRARPLDGVRLRCCTLLESPIVYRERSQTDRYEFSGLAISYLRLLEDALGFTCASLRLFNASEVGNQGFSGFIHEMEQCTLDGRVRDSPQCRCDIGTGGWIQNSERLGRVDFVSPYFVDDFGMLVHVDNIFPAGDGTFLFRAFSPAVWALIGGLMVCFITLKMIDGRFAPVKHAFEPLEGEENLYQRAKHFALKYPPLYRIRKATKSVLKWTIGQSSTGEIIGDAKSTRQWVVNYIILLSGLFLVLAYEAVMTASLVQEDAISDFRSINDVKSCRLHNSKVCIPRGGAVESLWRNVLTQPYVIPSHPTPSKPVPTHPSNRPISSPRATTSDCHRSPGAPQAVFVDDYATGHAMVANKSCDYFLASSATIKNAANGRYCGTVLPTGEPFFPGGISFVLPKGSNLTRHFNRATLDLGAEEKLPTVRKYLQQTGQCHVPRQVSLSARRLRVFFIAAYVACAALFVIMLADPHGLRKEDAERADRDEQKLKAAKYDLESAFAEPEPLTFSTSSWRTFSSIGVPARKDDAPRSDRDEPGEPGKYDLEIAPTEPDPLSLSECSWQNFSGVGYAQRR